MATVQVRYLVHDVDPEATPFYTQHLGFKLDMRPAPPFALWRAAARLRLGLDAPTGQGVNRCRIGRRRQADREGRFLDINTSHCLCLDV
jgi:hypothetical protein